MTTKQPDTSNIPTPPTPGLLRRIELAAIDKAGKLLGIPDKPKADKLHKLTPEQEKQLREIEDEAIANFHGDLDVLESALGMLRMGHHFGWRVLYLIHSKQTVRKYEQILGIRIRDVFDEKGPSSYRSIGLNLAQHFSNFWKVAGGDIKIPRRKSGVA